MGKHISNHRPRVRAAIITALLGWVLLLPLSTPNPLVRLSYDFLQLVLPHHGLTNIVVVHMDDEALRRYDQKPGAWSRNVHADLLDRLTLDEPRVVVFDATMTATSSPTADENFARALGDNKRVVLAADIVPITGLAFSGTAVPPLEQLETNAARWGIVKELLKDPDQVIRRYLPGTRQDIGLVWAAAEVSKARVAADPNRRLAVERWLNYYGSARPFEEHSMTYGKVADSPSGYFHDRAVFIGGKPDTLFRGDVTDVFATPFTKWDSQYVPGVELIALAYANLLKEDWLRRTGLGVELLLLLLTGGVAGASLRCIRRRPAAWLAAGLAALTIVTSIVVVIHTRIWFPWLVVVLIQIPGALFLRLFATGESLPRPLAEGEVVSARPTNSGTASPTVSDGRPEIPDHEVIRCIGEGAYGQVWIARNAIGLYHAVKVVYRSRFPMAAPYERALRGIQKFMPISRSHAGFVHILHVGRNDPRGFFFYIMEAADDALCGQQFDPTAYAPKTLASELRARGTIPLRECVDIMLALAAAVESLHQHQLIHRDIKPDNILFINGRPKLADIDLVTSLAATGEASRIGTDGYMAPEGPGSAAADVFSLGRVLYVALTGKAPAQCPELPTQVTSHPDCSRFLELNLIVCKACEFTVERRYASAAELHAGLLRISQLFEDAPTQADRHPNPQ